MRNRSKVSRARRAQIIDEVHQIHAVSRTKGLSVDQVQDELLQSFPGELGIGEARMYAEGWTVRTVREGLRKLATDDGLDATGLDDTCVWRWMRGQVYPRDWLERLCRLFQTHQAQLGWPPRGDEVPIDFTPRQRTSDSSLQVYLPGRSVSPPFETPGDGPAAVSGQAQDWTAWFSIRLAQLVTLVDQWNVELHSCQPLQLLLHQEVLMFDALRPAEEAERYHVSRRQMLITLVALPTALAPSLQPGVVSSPLMGTFLAYCAASITASWRLLKQSDLVIVEQNVSAYLLALAAAARQSSRYQAEAARLASQAYRVLGIVALHHKQFRTREYCFQQALTYADIADDPRMRASALISLGSTPLLYSNDPTRAAEIYERALAHAQGILPLQRSRIYAELAVALAMQGKEQDALQHLDRAYQEYPEHPEHDPSYIYAEFTPASFVLDRGLAYLALARTCPDRGYQTMAWDTFADIESLSLSLRSAVPQRIQVEILNHQAATAVEMRDLDLFDRYVRLGVAGARLLRSDQRRHEALQVWKQALDIWPSERRVKALSELFSDASAPSDGGGSGN
jgi:tetratricopeptide (TPR) repeat protein